MKPLLFIIKKSFKNGVLELKKKPLALIAYLFLTLLMIGMITLTFLMPSSLIKKGSIDTFGAIMSGALLTFVYFGIKQGISRGSSFFRFSDVNFVFTAPISPKKVLVYGLVQQFLLSFVMVMFVSFQIPNLKNNFPLSSQGVLLIYICVFVLFIAMQLIAMLLYSISSKSKALRNRMEKILNMIIAVFAGGFLLAVIKTQDFMKAAQLYLNSEYFNYIPFVGWFKVILLSSVKGIDMSFYMNLVLVVVSISIMMIVIYKLKTDYYEDVLAATEQKELIIKAKREGKGMSLRDSKVRNVVHQYSRTGARVIFNRHMLEYKKTGMFLINRNSIIVLASGIASKYFLPNSSMQSTLIFSIYLLFFFALQGKWAQELDKPYIYLIPDHSYKKVFYATLAETLKNGVDGLILFSAAGFMFKANIATILLSVLVYMSYGVIYTYGDVLSRKLFGKTHSRNMEIFLKMFITLVVMIPGIAIFITMSVLGFWELFKYGSVIIYNVAIACFLLFFSRGIFEKLEMK